MNLATFKRTTKLRKEHLPIVEGLAKTGLTPRAIAARIGVTRDTFLRWLELGRSPDPLDHDGGLLLALAMVYDTARAEYQEFLLGCVKAHTPTDWRAAKWLLEVQFPEYKDPHEKRFLEQMNVVLKQLSEFMSEDSYQELTNGLYLLSEGEISRTIETTEEDKESFTIEIESAPQSREDMDE